MKSHALIMPRLQYDIEVMPDRPTTMQFSRDRGLISDYKKLRKSLYKIDPRFVGFRIFSESDAENYGDPDDQMLLVHDENGHCLGGACLRISTSHKSVILDLEKDISPSPGKKYFSLRDSLPEMELDRYSYAEFNRIVLEPSLRKGEITKKMFLAILDRCIKYRVRYMFGIGDMIRTRLYKRIYSNVGVYCVIQKDLDIPMRPEYEGLKMHLLSGDMKKFHITPQDPDATALLSPRSDFQFD